MRIGITTDCTCDLPDEYMQMHDIGIVYFYITTSSGRFRDGFEITEANIIEYLENGGKKAETSAPTPEEYKEFFEKRLLDCDELVHIAISSFVSLSYENATAALKLMGENGKRVRVVNSHHLSTGMGHMVIKAVDCRSAGKSSDEIVAACEELKPHISTSFITKNADYLYRNGRVSKGVKNICSAFALHPVLAMKEGKISLKTVHVGNYERSIMRYVKSELKKSRKIDAKRLFVTHACCTVKTISAVKEEIRKIRSFEEIIVTKASATVSGNCGSETIGVLFVCE